MYDMHVHTSFSHDSKASIEEYVSLIEAGKLKAIGFSEHLDFMPECKGYGIFDYLGYKKAVEQYKQSGYQLFAGAEIDYAKKVESDIIESLKVRPFDYTICSVHMIDGLSISTTRNIGLFYDNDKFKHILETYYYEVSSSLKVKEFDVIGHIDLYRRYLEDKFFQTCALSCRIEELDYQLARECALSGKIIEVNSSGLFAPSQSVLPHNEFLKAYFDCGGRMVCLGSDAHTASNVARGFETAKEILKSIGFEYIFLPWDRENAIRLD